MEHLLWVLDNVVKTPEEEMDDSLKADRLMLYKDSNDAFRNLLTGKFGRLPLGFPPDWVYASAFGENFQEAIDSRTEASPLDGLDATDIETERAGLKEQIGTEPTDEELIMYLNHPGDALKTILFRHEFGNPNRLPLDVWFEGLETGRSLEFMDSDGLPHSMQILGIGDPDGQGMSDVRYTLDNELFSHSVKTADATGSGKGAIEMADKADPCQVGSPSKGDLWIMYVRPGDVVKKGEELFNITIMKQEKAVVSPMDGVVQRVVKTADYKHDKKMAPVQEGELLVVLGPPAEKCANCGAPVNDTEFSFCPQCGNAL